MFVFQTRFPESTDVSRSSVVKKIMLLAFPSSNGKLFLLPYVDWTVHHLDSWIKRSQLDVTCFIISLFNAQHVSDVNTSILRSLRLICWVITWVVLLWFDVCRCYVVVWLWWCGIRMQATCWALNNEIIKQVTSSWSLFIQLFFYVFR